MKEKKYIIYGPVPSRRLGQSLGINNIFPKKCPYSCIYCQLGRTNNQIIKRELFYDPKEIKYAIEKKIIEVGRQGENIDYISFVPNGEPTLDINLGKEIKIIKTLGFRVAVITNASILWDKDIQDDLSNVDYVSIKIDTVSEKNWNKINRPHNSLNFRKILTGLYKFSKNFHGKFVTETMIIKNINDNSQEFESIADFIDKLNSNKNYISIPTRPTAEKSCTPADEFDINMAYQIFKEKDLNVEFLTRYEGNTFVFTGNVEQDLLSITSVHPMREEGINNFLSRSEEDWNIIKKLIKENKLIEVKYKNKKFYMRKIPKKN